MKKQTLLIVIVVALILIAAVWMSMSNTQTYEETHENVEQQEISSEPDLSSDDAVFSEIDTALRE